MSEACKQVDWPTAAMDQTERQTLDAEALGQAADEFDRIAEDYESHGNDSPAQSARARAYELRQVLSRMVRALGVGEVPHG